MATVKYYRDMQDVLMGKTPKVKRIKMSDAPGNKMQVAARVIEKLTNAWERKEAEKSSAADRAMAIEMAKDYSAPPGVFNPAFDGTSSEDLLEGMSNLDTYKDSLPSENPNISPKDSYNWQGDQTDLPDDFGIVKAQSTLEQDADAAKKAPFKNVGMTRIDRNIGSGVYNLPNQSLFGSDNGEMGPRTQAMQLALLGQERGREDAATARERAMEEFKEKERIKAQYKVDPYQRPYDTTAGIKNARRIKELRLALQSAVGPEAKKLAEQNLSDFEYVLSKAPAAIRIQAQSKAAGTAAIKASGEAWKSLYKVKTNIANIGDAIRAIDAGAQSGPIYKMMPSIRAASVELDNVQNRMGLDVIGTVTFGALSKGELDLALSTALPTGLEPAKLREWLVTKRSAQQKLSRYLSDATIYLGTPGNTVSSWAKKNKSKVAPPSEEDILATMKANNMTRKEVMDKLGGK